MVPCQYCYRLIEFWSCVSFSGEAFLARGYKEVHFAIPQFSVEDQNYATWPWTKLATSCMYFQTCACLLGILHAQRFWQNINLFYRRLKLCRFLNICRNQSIGILVLVGSHRLSVIACNCYPRKFPWSICSQGWGKSRHL